MEIKIGILAFVSQMVMFLIFTDTIMVKPQGPWFNRRYQFYIHNESKSWNEAETICMSTGMGVSLLMVHDALAWDMWTHLLGTLHQESGKYWFGLTSNYSNNVNITFNFFWSGCEDSTFRTPLVPDFEENGTCVYMWFHREVFTDSYQDRWYFGQDCLSEAPFVCSVYVPDRACFLRTCDDVIVPVNSTNCSALLCNLLPPNLTCNYHYVEPEGHCHLWVNHTDGDNTTRTVCFLPNTEATITYCSGASEPVNYTVNATVDVGDVNDNCPVFVEPVNISSLFETKHYIYYKRQTSWNSAHEVCDLQNGTLLTFVDQTDMEEWFYLLTATLFIGDGPWLGLHVPDITSPNRVLWGDCSTTFLNGSQTGETPDASCAAFTDQGLHLKACNETRPFICEFEFKETSCQSTVCNDIFLFINETGCDESLCRGHDGCTFTYLPLEGMCKLHNNVSSNTTASCFVPRNISERCNETIDVADTYFTTPDNNTEVTNSKCSGEGNSTAKPPISTCPPRRRSCPCNCDLVTTFLRDPVDDEEVLTVEERTEQIVSELTVDKKNTTLSRMRYMSARDNRTSAVGIGAVAALIIFSIIGVIVLIDLTRMIHDIKNGLGGLLTMLGLHGLHSAMKLQRVPDNTTHDSPVIASATSTAVSSLSETPLTITECPDYMDFVSDEIFGMNMDIGGHVPPASTSLS